MWDYFLPDGMRRWCRWFTGLKVFSDSTSAANAITEMSFELQVKGSGESPGMSSNGQWLCGWFIRSVRKPIQIQRASKIQVLGRTRTGEQDQAVNEHNQEQNQDQIQLISLYWAALYGALWAGLLARGGRTHPVKGFSIHRHGVKVPLRTLRRPGEWIQMSMNQMDRIITEHV